MRRSRIWRCAFCPSVAASQGIPDHTLTPQPGGQGYSTREQLGWYFYDCANSAFSTTVVTLFFGPYLTALAKQAAAQGSLRIAPQSVWPYLVSLSVLTQVLAFPLI